MRALDLFSGIGAFALALEGFVETAAFCELDPDARRVLEDRMREGRLPAAPVFEDVRTLTARELPRGINAIVGGWPCQDMSPRGLRRGLAGSRSGLFDHVVRLVRELRPRLVFLENVPNAIKLGLGTIVQALATELGYELRWCVVPASTVGANHVRRRAFFLAVRPGARLRFDAPSRPFRSRLGAAEPTRMVPPSTPHRTKRCQMLGHALVPDAARAAFVTLVSGFAVAPSRAALNPGPLSLRALDAAACGLRPTARAPTWGCVIGGVLVGNAAPAMLVPNQRLEFVPRAQRRAHTQEPREGVGRAPPVRRRITAAAWATPRVGGINAGNVLTARMAGDLATQVRFEASTPQPLRPLALDPEFVEWLMGVPRGWTRLPDGHATREPIGYRVKRPPAAAAEQRATSCREPPRPGPR